MLESAQCSKNIGDGPINVAPYKQIPLSFDHIFLEFQSYKLYMEWSLELHSIYRFFRQRIIRTCLSSFL
jgi:hypothetical protein